jgi:hypothetical protein
MASIRVDNQDIIIEYSTDDSKWEIVVDEIPTMTRDNVTWHKYNNGNIIYLPDVTPVNKEIVHVKYDWQQMKAYITIADRFRPGPHEFDCTTTWTDQDCIDAINQKFL